ncbi:MAG: hypothetical protein AABZ30_16580 [Myxococcota bacterium]
MRLPLALASLLAAFASTAAANDTNYQNYIVGERALGLGGAFTALADDASGAFYNPAGLALVPTTSLSASLSVYGIEKHRRERGYRPATVDEPIDLESSEVATLPTTVALVRKFGQKLRDGVSRHAIGLSTYMPYATSFHADRVIEGRGSHERYQVSESDKTIWTGPVYALRLTPRLSIGVATFYSYRTVRNRWRRAIEHESALDPDLSADVEIEEDVAEWGSGDLFGGAGARFDASDAWSLGVSLTTPAAHVHGSGRLADETTIAFADSPVLSYTPVENTGLETRNEYPWGGRAGVAYSVPGHWLVAGDLSVHGPATFSPIVVPDDLEPRAVVANHVATVRREAVVNGNVGGEYYLAGFIPVRAGAFTNFSSAPDVKASPDERALAHVDMYGVTTSVGYVTGDYDVSFGVVYSFGSGTAYAWSQATQQFEPSPTRSDLVYFYITGAQKALHRVAKRVAGQRENKPPAAPSKPPEGP